MTPKTLLAVAVFVLAPLSAETQRSENAARRIEAAKARASAVGVPVQLLELRIAEGRAKGVSEERIAAAVERRAAGLANAQEAMSRSGSRPTPAELAAGADALEAGVDAQALRMVAEAARTEDRSVALAVLGELVKQGIPADQALERVTTALKRRDGAVAKLPEQAAAARERRGPPEGVGRPSGVGSGRPNGVGGKPAGVPTAGKPGGGKPAGTPGGRPKGTPGGRP